MPEFQSSALSDVGSAETKVLSAFPCAGCGGATDSMVEFVPSKEIRGARVRVSGVWGPMGAAEMQASAGRGGLKLVGPAAERTPAPIS